MFTDLKYKAIPLGNDLFCLTGPNSSRFPYCMSFLFMGEETVLIDTGVGADTLKAVDATRRIDTVVFTHSHPDHVINWHLFNDRRIFMPKETPPSIADLHQLGFRFMGTTEKAEYWAMVIGDGLGLKPFREPDGRFEDGDIIDTGRFRLRAIHTPGHLADHYCFFEETTQTLFSGDIDFSGFGPFYGQPECDIKQFIASIQRVMDLPHSRVCASHKPPVTGDVAGLFTAFLDGFNRHSEAILQLIDTPRTIPQIVAHSPLYKDLMPDKIFQETFETGMVSKNLAMMLEDGRVVKEDEHHYRAAYS